MLTHFRNRSFYSEAVLITPWLALSIIHLSGIIISDTVQYIAFLISMVMMGIPHGALDHLVEEQNKKLNGKEFSIAQFLFNYILRMSVFALIWFISPIPALIIFLAISAVHFGETDLNEKSMHTFLYGSGLLLFLLTTHIDSVTPIISGIPSLRFFDSTYLKDYSSYFTSFFGLLSIFTVAIHSKPASVKIKLIVRTVIILFVMYNLPLIPAFTFYFGCWHSIRSMDFIRKHLSTTQHKMSWNMLLKKALPFTTAALLFILILIFVLNNIYGMSVTLMSLFIGVAILTAPHLSVMSDMYVHLKKTKRLI